MRNSDLLLDDFDKEQHGYPEKKKSRCFQTLGVATVLVALLAVVGVFAFFALPKSLANSDDSQTPFLKSPHHLCDTCHINPEVEDYVLCSSCGFEPSQNKMLKCPKGYGNMFVTKARYGPQQSAQIEGKIYTHCKEEMMNGGAECNVNLKELIPDLKDVSPPPPGPMDKHEWRGRGKDWRRHKDWMPPSPFFGESFDIFPIDEFLPEGPNEESFLDDAMEEDAQIMEALAQEPEITTMEALFLAMPHAPSLKLHKALMKCMTPGVRGSKTPPACANGATLLKCRGADSGNELCLQKTKGVPLCSDGAAAACPEGTQSFKKGQNCWPEDLIGEPVKPVCADNKNAKKCKKKGVVNPACQGQKGKKMFCVDSSEPTCPAGFVDKKDFPKCVADDGVGENVQEQCADGSEPQKCGQGGVVSEGCVNKRGKAKKGKRCADGSKGECPAGYGSGPCIGGAGERRQLTCEDPTDKVIKCHKKKHQQKPICAGQRKPMCKTSQAPAECPPGYTFDQIDKIDAPVTEGPFLSSPRYGRPGHGHIFTGEEAYLLPHGPNGESLLAHTTPEDQPIIDALMETPRINNLEDLYSAIPHEHPISFKLSKALMRCMENGDTSTTTRLVCQGDAELLGKGKCKGVMEGDALFDACQLKKQKTGKTPLCSDGQYATCPDGYESYSKNPQCVDNTGEGERLERVCEDGSEPINCKKDKTNPECDGKVKKNGKGKKFVCATGKPICPDGYSRGECKNYETGERSRAKCPVEEGMKEKPIKCHKKKNRSKPECAETMGPVCPTTMAPPVCEEGTELDFSDYRTDLEVGEPAAMVLEARRPPHHGRPPFGRGPRGNGPKGRVEVDFLCLRVDLN